MNSSADRAASLDQERKTSSRRLYSFVGGAEGEWRVRSVRPWRGAGLKHVAMLSLVEEDAATVIPDAGWRLKGAISHLRYTTRRDRDDLAARQPALGRAEAGYAALIPIRKSPAWWDLAQDERRAIFEEISHHTAIGFEFLPAIGRRLYHSRDLGEVFDFLTWFEFAPSQEAQFDELLSRLRATAEWTFVEREVDIRLVAAPGSAKRPALPVRTKA